MAVNHKWHLPVYGWLERGLRHLLAPPCRFCGEPPRRTPEVCAPCHRALPWLGAGCPRCGEPMTTGGRICGRCLRRPPPWERLTAAFVYTEPVAGLVRAFKLHGDLAAGRLLADLLAERLHAQASPLAPLILPVPLHPRRLRTRGFNQAAEIARRLPGPVEYNALHRLTAGPHQRGHGIAERWRNVRRAFSVRAPRLPAHVAIVDDVVTTGATAAALATVLRRAGVDRVDVYALAKTPRR